MASGLQRLVVLLLLLFFLVVSTTAVPITRSLKEVQNRVSVGNFHSQDVKEIDKNDGLQVKKLERFMKEGRMNLELEDYPETGANSKHDPNFP